MSVLARMLPAMPKVEWRIADDLTGIGEFSHISTTLRSGGAPSDLPRGETVWATAQDEGKAVYMTWEWVEARPGLVALSDPNMIAMNAEMLDMAGQPLDEWKVIQAKNVVAHTVPWQQLALETIREARVHDNPAAGNAGFLSHRGPAGPSSA